MIAQVSLLIAGLLFGFAITAQGQVDRASSQSTEDYELTLRILPNADYKTLARIAEFAEPERYQPSGQETYKQIARERYGVFNGDIRKLMRQFNPQLHSFSAKPHETVILPPGPHWSFQVESKLLTGSDPSQELLLRSGSAGRYNLRTFFEANPKLAKILDRLPAGVKLKIPYVAQVVSFRLKPEYASRRAEIEQTLNSLRAEGKEQPVVIGARISPAGRLVPSLTEGHLASVSVGRPSAATPFWPYTSMFWQSRQIAFLHQNTALVAVLDTGIPRPDQESGLPTGVLWTNRDEIPDNYVDDDKSLCIDDIYGCDLLSGSTRGFPMDDNDEGEVTYHGTHVAGLLVGALLPNDARKQVQDSMRLMTLKVVDSRGSVDIGATASAIVYALDKHVNIINMSLEIPRDDPSLRNALEAGQKSNVLFVVAAGNAQQGEGLNLDSQDVDLYPAQYSRDFPDQVITVAAHDAQGKLAPFSNWGEKTVDLAAPGVDVESLASLKTQKLSGTSQATPIVTLAAELLYAEGVVDAAAIKRRLMASVDYDPSLKGKVSSAGRLNIAKALAVNEDVVQLNSGELVRGELLGRDPLQIAGLDTPLNFGEVQKIIFNYSENPATADLVLTYTRRNGPRRFEQTLDMFPLRIKQADGVRIIQRSEARDLVPR